MEQIEILLWTSGEELIEKPFLLTSSSGNQYLSREKGTLGGHKKLKIYGRMDLPFCCYTPPCKRAVCIA